jgi:phosphohistidine phosphatase
MDLILWRHADAEDGVPDLERRLTPRGLAQAERVAGWLDRQLPGECRVLVSPARRAQQTALALRRKSMTVDALAPGASVDAVLAAAAWPDARTPALIVGHQPTLGEVVAFLLAGDDRDYAFRKGGVYWLTGAGGGATAEVSIKATITPDSV